MGVCTDDIGGLYKKDKCCCTKFGEAWGFGCAQCPKPGTLAFEELCPKGYGFVNNVDVNECLAFPDMCQNGRCKNTLGKVIFFLLECFSATTNWETPLMMSKFRMGGVFIKFGC